MKSLAVLVMLSAAALAGDVTGTWYFAVELSVGSGAPTFVFKQEGTKLTGTYSGTLGQAPIAGKVEGNKIEFSFDTESAGQKFKVVYTGTVKSDKAMEGKVNYGEIGDGTWTAKKKE